MICLAAQLDELSNVVHQWVPEKLTVEIPEEHKTESLASTGGAAEALQVRDLWQFLSRRRTGIKSVTDSSLHPVEPVLEDFKHIDARYLWLQLKIKKQSLSMEGVPTLWNVSDLGTKRLTRQRREFLMYLIGLVERGEGENGFFPGKLQPGDAQEDVGQANERGQEDKGQHADG